MHLNRGKSTQGFNYSPVGDIQSFINALSFYQLGDHGAGGYGSSTAESFEFNIGNDIVSYLYIQFHDVAAYRVSDMPDAVGGMAIGADPITAGIITIAGQQGTPLKGFIVRKEEKQHGAGRMVEGPVEPGDSAVIVEDVVTTGGGSLKAIQHAEAFGLKIKGVVAIIDRLEGGSQAFADAGYELRTLLTIRDFGIEPPAV